MSRDSDYDFFLACEAEAYRNPAKPTVAAALVFWATVLTTILCGVFVGPLLGVVVLFGGALVSAMLHKTPPPTEEFKIDRARYLMEKESCR